MPAVPELVRQSARFSFNRQTDCTCNLQTVPTISHILTAPTYHTTLSTPSLFPVMHHIPVPIPCTPLPLPLTHPITLTPNMERTRMRQHLLHIPAQTLPFSAHLAAKWACTPEQDFRLGNLVPEVVTSLGNRLEWVSRVRKKGLGLLQDP